MDTYYPIINVNHISYNTNLIFKIYFIYKSNKITLNLSCKIIWHHYFLVIQSVALICTHFPYITYIILSFCYSCMSTQMVKLNNMEYSRWMFLLVSCHLVVVCLPHALPWQPKNILSPSPNITARIIPTATLASLIKHADGAFFPISKCAANVLRKFPILSIHQIFDIKIHSN